MNGDPAEPTQSGTDAAAPDGVPLGEEEDGAFDEVREAAGAVVASLKWLIDATERVIEDPEAFARVVDGGRGVVEAFAGGFLGSDAAPEADEPAAAPGSDDPGGDEGNGEEDSAADETSAGDGTSSADSPSGDS